MKTETKTTYTKNEFLEYLQTIDEDIKDFSFSSRTNEISIIRMR